MKKNVWGIMFVFLFASVSLVYAEGMKGDMMDKGMKGGMMGEGMMKGGMMDKGGMMMGMGMMQAMMQKQVVSTNDGGIIVVTANKLTKYDKDLNVVKEVELKMDMEGMQKMMENMKSMCPMMGKMKPSDDTKAEELKESAQDEKAEHESHHPENK
ncbi:MAG: hypothetical protein H6753_01035 [Candidatus Omnitrophica bacterium]|nr:hypothetical protein [Candidatus Omnitrophota bacterium]